MYVQTDNQIHNFWKINLTSKDGKSNRKIIEDISFFIFSKDTIFIK